MPVRGTQAALYLFLSGRKGSAIQVCSHPTWKHVKTKTNSRRAKIVSLSSTRIKRRHPEGVEAATLKQPDKWVHILVVSHTSYVTLGQCIPCLCLPQFPTLAEWA